MLPQVAEKARMAACHPKVVKLLMINLFEPIEMPKINSRSTMVHEMVFSVFCKKAIFLKRYPIAIPVNMVPIMVNMVS